MQSEVTHRAGDPVFNYYGRWHRAGDTAITINSGAYVEFAYTGDACALAFDVAGFTQFPAVFLRVDNGPIAKTTLSPAVSAVPVAPPFPAFPAGEPPYAAVAGRQHLVRCWVAAHSLYLTPAAGTQWTALDGGCRFLGVRIDHGALLPLPYATRQIEFLGDSITQGLRLLYTGADDDTGQQLPYANWTQLAADLLDLRPVVTGFGGQGLAGAGTSGAPEADAAFPWCYHGARYVPAAAPQAVVIYQGTNDGIAAEAFAARYAALLAAVAGARPAARLFAVCPHNQARYAEAIRDAVASRENPHIHFLDYSTGVIALEDTCDGCHLNPGGAVRLAARLAHDIRAVCPAL